MARANHFELSLCCHPGQLRVDRRRAFDVGAWGKDASVPEVVVERERK